MKSHKDPVTCRAVHSLPAFTLEAHARWLMKKLRGVLGCRKHLVKSSLEVARAVAKLEVDGKLFFVHLDIKDFCGGPSP